MIRHFCDACEAPIEDTYVGSTKTTTVYADDDERVILGIELTVSGKWTAVELCKACVRRAVLGAFDRLLPPPVLVEPT